MRPHRVQRAAGQGAPDGPGLLVLLRHQLLRHHILACKGNNTTRSCKCSLQPHTCLKADDAKHPCKCFLRPHSPKGIDTRRSCRLIYCDSPRVPDSKIHDTAHNGMYAVTRYSCVHGESQAAAAAAGDAIFPANKCTWGEYS
jgi:hypothetical protein